MRIMYQLGCFRFGKYASSQATYSSAVMFPSVHSSRIVRALYFQVLNSFSLSCLERDIIVQGNPRVYKALKDQLGEITRRT